MSSIPGSAIPEGPVPETDKLVHIALYGVLGFFCAQALAARGRGGRPISSKLIFAAALLATAYGVTDEIHQIFTPRRSCDWHDVVADAIGGLLGAFVATRWLARAKKGEEGRRRAKKGEEGRREGRERAEKAAERPDRSNT